MSFGKLYTSKDNPRSTTIKAVAKASKLDLEIVEINPGIANVTADYLKFNKLGKIPTFVGADGYVLTECIAIAIYVTSQNEKTTLLGKTKQDYASILKWLSFGNAEILPQLGNWFAPLLGRVPYNKRNVEDAQKATNARIKILDDHLLVNTYLVGERLTLADLFVAATLFRGFQNVFDKNWRDEYSNLVRWYETVHNQPIYSEISGKPTFIDEAVKYTPPKKEAAPPKKEAAAPPKKEAKAVDDDEEEDKPAPKPKHPLDALPRSIMVLDDWKRKYSNEDTRSVAMPWFWENCKFDEFSLWQIDYKYNEELTQIFMSSNLIGGFFNRLEASRKFLFGSCSVYGQTGDSIIRGAFLVRGHEALPAFDVAPDFESYEFSKLDHTKAEDRKFVESMWSWDEPIVVKGKTYPHADGKVFK